MQKSQSFEMLSLSLQKSQQNIQLPQAPTSTSSMTLPTTTTPTHSITSLANNKFLPKLLYLILHNPRGSILGLLASYLLTLLFWLPSYLLSYLLTEIGIYIITLLTIHTIGRIILISLTFPGGASFTKQRILAEIEKEFMKYCIKVLDNSCHVIKENGVAVLRMMQSNKNDDLDDVYDEIHHHCDNVFGMYYNILSHLLQMTTWDKLVGDVGNLQDISYKAKEEGKILTELLSKTLRDVSYVLDGLKKKDVQETIVHNMLATINELKDYLVHMSNGILQDVAYSSDDEENPVPSAASRESMLSNIKTSFKTIKTIINPPFHNSIFGLDVLRGILLSKYTGSKQIWIPRGTNDSLGSIDAIFIPSQVSKKKIVLYCNPNAGMYEVSTGFSTEAKNNWIEYYLNNGYDVLLFNYSCYGRSYSNGLFFSSKQIRNDTANILKSIINFVGRIQPSPSSLKRDGIIVAKYILNTLKYDCISIVHGESIGGMVAANISKYFSKTKKYDSLTTALISSNKHPISLLICDRTFSSLNTTAQYLLNAPFVGKLIKLLTPFWNTDVAYDYLNSTCPKIVANDSNDKIILHPSSLQSGIAYYKEYGIYPDSSTTIPFLYRLSDYYYDDYSILEGYMLQQKNSLFYSAVNPPVWPADKRISLKEAYYFAACIRRIGKLATAAKRTGSFDGFDMAQMVSSMQSSSSQQSNTMNSSFFVIQLWAMLSTADGLCGCTLGHATKIGFFSIVGWLANAVTFGPQMLHNSNQSQDYPTTIEFGIPIPQLITKLKQIISDESHHHNFSIITSTSSNTTKHHLLFHEIVYISSMFEYIHRRLTSNLIIAQQQEVGSPFRAGVGKVLNLHCGHNNCFLENEKEELLGCIRFVEDLDDDDEV